MIYNCVGVINVVFTYLLEELKCFDINKMHTYIFKKLNTKKKNIC